MSWSFLISHLSNFLFFLLNIMLRITVIAIYLRARCDVVGFHSSFILQSLGSKIGTRYYANEYFKPCQIVISVTMTCQSIDSVFWFCFINYFKSYRKQKWHNWLYLCIDCSTLISRPVKFEKVLLKKFGQPFLLIWLEIVTIARWQSKHISFHFISFIKNNDSKKVIRCP